MTHGRVIGLVRYAGGEPTMLHVLGLGDAKLCLRVKEKPGARIHLGDRVWWKACWVFWRSGPAESEVRLPRVGSIYTPGAES